MDGPVDMVRLSPLDTGVFTMLNAFRANETGAAPLPLTANSDCNGYWKRPPGWNCRPKRLTLLTTVIIFNAVLKIDRRQSELL